MIKITGDGDMPSLSVGQPTDRRLRVERPFYDRAPLDSHSHHESRLRTRLARRVGRPGVSSPKEHRWIDRSSTSVLAVESPKGLSTARRRRESLRASETASIEDSGKRRRHAP